MTILGRFYQKNLKNNVILLDIRNVQIRTFGDEIFLKLVEDHDAKFLTYPGPFKFPLKIINLVGPLREIPAQILIFGLCAAIHSNSIFFEFQVRVRVRVLELERSNLDVPNVQNRRYTLKIKSVLDTFKSVYFLKASI